MSSLFLTFALLWGYGLVGHQFNEARLIPKYYNLHFKLDPLSKTLSGNVTCQMYVEEKTGLIEMFADPSISVKNVTIVPGKNNSNTSLYIKNIGKEAGNRLLFTVDQQLQKNATYNLTVVFEGIKSGNTSSNSSFYMFNGTESLTNRSTTFYVIDLTKNTTTGLFPCFYGPKYVHFRTPFNLTIIRPKLFNVYTISNVSVQLQNKLYADYYYEIYTQTIPIRIHQFALVATNSSQVIEISKKESLLCPEGQLPFTINKHLLTCALKHLSSFYGIPMTTNSVSLIPMPSASNISLNAFGLKSYKEGEICTTLQSIINQLSEFWLKFYPHSIHPSSEPLLNAISWLATFEIFPAIIKKSNASEYDDFYSLIKDNSYKAVIQTPWNKIKNASSCSCYRANREILIMSLVKNLLGTPLFTEGLKDLLSKKHHPLKEEDVWKHLSQAAMKNQIFSSSDSAHSIEEIVKTFKNQSASGLPLITLNVTASGSIIHGSVTQVPFATTKFITEYREFLKEANKNGTPSWKVPLQLVALGEKFNDQVKTLIWIKNQNQTVSLNNLNLSQKEFLAVNPDVQGPYLMNYRKEDWDKLYDNFDSIPTKYRSRMMMDIHVLAESSNFNYTDYMKFILKLQPSKEYFPDWQNYLCLIPDVESRLSGPALNLTRQWLLKQLNEVYKQLNSSQIQPFWLQTLRNGIHSFLCMKNSSVCGQKYNFSFILNSLKTPEKINIGHACPHMKNITQEQWIRLISNMTKYCKNYTNYELKSMTYLFTQCIQDQKIISTFLDSILKKHQNISQCCEKQLATILGYFKMANNGSSILYKYFIQNWKEITLKFPNHIELITDVAITNLKSEREINDALQFLKNEEVRNKIPSHALDVSLKKLEEQLTWNKSNLSKIEKLFSEALKRGN